MIKYTYQVNGETISFESKREINTIILCDSDEGHVSRIVSKSLDAEKLIAKETSHNRDWLSNFRSVDFTAA